MHFKKLLITMVSITTFVSTINTLYSQDSKQSGGPASEKQSSPVLDAFEKNLDSQIAVVNKNLTQYSDLMNLEVTHSPAQSRFTKGAGFIQLEKYDFLYESPNSTTVSGGKVKTMKLYYNGQTLTKIESTIVEENYKLRTKRLLKVTDPNPATEENGDILIFNQLNKENAEEVKLSEMHNTISEPNRIKFKKEFYLEFLTNLEEDLRYTRKYVDIYGTNSHVNTIEALKKAVNY